MSEAEQLLARVEQLKATAEQHKSKQDRARALEEKAKLDLEELDSKLEQLFGTDSWTKAEKLLPKLTTEAELAIAEVEQTLASAGLL